MDSYAPAPTTALVDAGTIHRAPSLLVPVAVDRVGHPGAYLTWVKPVMDGLLALVLLVLLLPVMVAVALAVRVQLGPGVFYRQQRIGHHGRAFSMVKFRTMAPDRRRTQRSLEGPDRRVCHKREDDPRHTTLGRFLRKSSLDELPQLLHVIAGQMSLVGPRPELVEVVEAHYQPWQHARHQVKPGITGFWQVSGRGNGLAHEGVDLDLAYIDRLSFLTDCRVLVDTVLVVAKRTGK